MSPTKSEDRSALTSAETFLSTAYNALQYDGSVGFADPTTDLDHALEGGSVTRYEWLKLAKDSGAHRIFFVNDYPAVVFFKLDAADEDGLRLLHKRMWNMSRPPFYFVALPGELRIYDAYEKPIRQLGEWNQRDRWLERVKTITEIAEKMQCYSRREMESERAFGSLSRTGRADQWLLRNLGMLRAELRASGLSATDALNLIGRSIFTRYLEDRKVLVSDYFQEVSNGRASTYGQLLESKIDTYKFFKRLRYDFNGNMFPLTDGEEKAVTPERLGLLREFLNGQRMDHQHELFFWAYEFDVIPVELISSIYEEFYHSLDGTDQQGTHYTPTVLVDFVLTQSLTDKQLASGKVIDLACGSGIFLVQAFRRMVYHHMRELGRRPSAPELAEIMQERIFGVDINGAAVQVAAFSLYLTLLDFMEPSDIRIHRLPLLVHEPNATKGKNGENLFEANSFDLSQREKDDLAARGYQPKRSSTGRNGSLLPLGDRRFDVIVGNPPWGAVGRKNKEGQKALKWCQLFDFPVGDNELSQCFIWRARSLLAPDGKIGLLVSSGIFFKNKQESRAFRRAFLEENSISAIYNFAHVRHSFFTGQKSSSDAPFAAIFLAPATKEKALRNRFVYASAQRSQLIENLQAVVLDKSNRHIVLQREVLQRDTLWKTLIWGSRLDADLIDELEDNKRLGDFVPDRSMRGSGFHEGGGKRNYHSSQLDVSWELPVNAFARTITPDCLVRIKPHNVHRLGNPNIYRGTRLLVKRGITEGKKDKLAEIEAALVATPFAFRNSIHGFRLDEVAPAHRKVILGIMWSSLALYYHFLTCSTWGFWHHEIHLDEHLRLPVRLPRSRAQAVKIASIVDRLALATEDDAPLFNRRATSREELERRLDDAIFELYELDDSRCDRIRDFMNSTLDFFYRGYESISVKAPAGVELVAYAEAFSGVWRGRLDGKGKALMAHIFSPVGNPMVGMAFELGDNGDSGAPEVITEDDDWDKWLGRLAKVTPEPLANRIYLDRVVKVLSKNSILILKRAERRLWTKSQARQDAHEMLTEVFKVEWRIGTS